MGGQADRDSLEKELLVEELNRVSGEIGRRHVERYRLHALGLIAVGLTGAFFGISSDIIPVEVKIVSLSVLPFLCTAIMALMLKEHQYINMRDRYLDTVIRPNLERLVGGKIEWLGWEKFETRQMGRSSGLPYALQRWYVFAFLGALDYAIPGFVTLAALVGYVAIFRGQVGQDLRTVGDSLSLVAGLFFAIVAGLVVWLRLREKEWFPVAETLSRKREEVEPFDLRVSVKIGEFVDDFTRRLREHDTPVDASIVLQEMQESLRSAGFDTRSLKENSPSESDSRGRGDD